MNAPSLCGAISLWAHRTPGVAAVVLVGSRARPADDPLAADPASDWDFQLVVRRPADFCSPRWTDELGCGPLRAYVVRKALWEEGLKINVSFPAADADLMILPARSLRKLRWRSRLGWHRREGWTRRSLQALIAHVRPHWRFLKGGDWLGPLYRRAADELPDPRLDDAAIRQLAAGVEWDLRWMLRQIGRGELLAAQRALHLELAEVNFRLSHELRLRQGRPTFEKARRLERFSTADERLDLTVDAVCETEDLRAAAARAARTCRRLARALLEGPPLPLPKPAGKAPGP